MTYHPNGYAQGRPKRWPRIRRSNDEAQHRAMHGGPHHEKHDQGHARTMWLVMALAVADAVLIAVRAGHRLCAILQMCRSQRLSSTSVVGGKS